MSDHAHAPIRHGEILLMPCGEPDAASVTAVERDSAPVVGHSETGHHHVLECPVPVEVIHADGTYVRLSEPGTLVQLRRPTVTATCPSPRACTRSSPSPSTTPSPASAAP